MKALVVYESMYGNTRLVAEAIGRGLARTADVDVVPVGQATPALLRAVDLVVAGGPTHAHGMSRASTRKSAVDQANDGVIVEPKALEAGLREWFDALDGLNAASAAFDTRVHLPLVLTGRASKGIARQLCRHGAVMIEDPESFLVTKDNRLEPGEEARAEQWGAMLAARTAGTARS
jgi:flavodoxin-like protein